MVDEDYQKREIDVSDTKATDIVKLTDAEARARNSGINPDMPSNIRDANGTRWANSGPHHDTRKDPRSARN